jgi:prephenate dehydrogenase
MINRLCIVGVGLIGGSLARDLRVTGSVGEVVGYGRGLDNLQLAVELGVIDRAAVSLDDAVRDADMVVLAVPVGAIGDVLANIAPSLAEGCVVTDVGSVKGSVVAAARPVLGGRFAQFVPGHPIAGTERSGVRASLTGLFRDRRVILTPEPDTDGEAVNRVRAMWELTGAQVVTMSAVEHDQVLAASSHLPHVLAYALLDLFVRMDDHRKIFECAAGGFRDFTRIASSDPVLWRDICLANRDAIAAILRQYQNDLGAMVDAIENGDGRWLEETFARAKHARDALLPNSDE